MNNKLLKAAIQEAEKSTYSHRVGAIIYYRDRVISRGHNYSQKSVRSITKRYIKWPNSIHAEVDAIINAKTDIKGMNLIVVRLNKKGELRLSKP
jgi:deoxycytidylate deaminase